MNDGASYWTSTRMNRRAALRRVAALGGAGVALGLAACSSSKNNTANAPAAATAAAGAKSTANPKAAAAAVNATPVVGGVNATPAAVDWTKGKPGGTLGLFDPNFPVSVDLVSHGGGQAREAGLTHSGLIAFTAGKAGVDPNSLDMEPDAAQSLPEQPDQLTLTFKLRPGIKFSTGRVMTSDDVKYSFDRYAFDNTSLYKPNFDWLDHIEVPDAQTVVFKSKAPNADGIYDIVAYQAGYILLKEHEESANANDKLVGSGPYIWDSANQGISVTLKKNPDYFLKPYPYIDTITFYTITDTAKQVADFVSKQVQFTWWTTPVPAQQISQQRPDAQRYPLPVFGYCLMLRVDQPPFTDKRVRQALSRSIDRAQITQVVEGGSGSADTALDWSQCSYWGARKPEELQSAVNWKYDPQSAKQLLSAAGITSPIAMPFIYGDAATIQDMRDSLALVFSNWKQNGIANFSDNVVAQAKFNDTALFGQFDGIASFFTSLQPVFGTRIKQLYWSPPSGAAARSSNSSHLNDPQLNQLIEKNLTQFNIDDRRQTMHQIDEIMGDEQYRPAFVTRTNTWFTDPSLKDASVYSWAQVGTAGYLKYWWFG